MTAVQLSSIHNGRLCPPAVIATAVSVSCAVGRGCIVSKKRTNQDRKKLLANAQYRYTNRIAQKQRAAKEKEIKESGREPVHAPAEF